MKIGVMSDTHGHLDVMRQAAAKMVNEHGVEAIVHLGDDSTDCQELNSLAVDIYWVPGVFEARYQDPSIANRSIKEFEDIPFLLTHTPTRDSHDIEGDIDPAEAIEDGDVRVVLHGHSHLWRIGEEKGVVIINPGHLIPRGDKGSRDHEPTYAILDVTSKRLDVKIVSLAGDLVAEKTFFFES